MSQFPDQTIIIQLDFGFQEGGVRALYRGLLPTLCGMVPYAGFSFYCFEMMKYFSMKYLAKYTCSPCPKNTGLLYLISTVEPKFILRTLIRQICSNPLETFVTLNDSMLKIPLYDEVFVIKPLHIKLQVFLVFLGETV